MAKATLTNLGKKVKAKGTKIGFNENIYKVDPKDLMAKYIKLFSDQINDSTFEEKLNTYIGNLEEDEIKLTYSIFGISTTERILELKGQRETFALISSERDNAFSVQDVKHTYKKPEDEDDIVTKETIKFAEKSPLLTFDEENLAHIANECYKVIEERLINLGYKVNSTQTEFLSKDIQKDTSNVIITIVK